MKTTNEPPSSDHDKLMDDLRLSVEKRREFVETLPDRARTLFREGKGEEALEMVLAELIDTQRRNSALHKQ